MFRLLSWRLGAAVGRSSAAKAAAAATAAVSPAATSKRLGRPPGAKNKRTASTPRATHVVKKKNTRPAQVAIVHDDVSDEKLGEADVATNEFPSARPAYMTAEREKEVMSMAERMQGRDITGDVPVASFAYEILKAHPSVRTMGLRERMDFLCTRWEKLSAAKKLDYLNNPLRGLL